MAPWRVTAVNKWVVGTLRDHGSPLRERWPPAAVDLSMRLSTNAEAVAHARAGRRPTALSATAQPPLTALLLQVLFAILS